VKNLFKALKIAIPKKRGEDRETTEQKYLKRLGKRFPVFNGILDVRKRGKLLSDYLWTPAADGTIRTTYGFHPSTWRKSSRNPNLMVFPRPSDESDLPGLVRETVTAPPGYLLMEADSEGIEAVLVAYDIGSPRMMKVAKAGIHGYFLSHVLHQPIDWQLPFADLRAACKKMKKQEPMMYDKCKRVVHGPLTADHDVLTESGWLPICDYKNQPIAQWHEDGTIIFAPAGLYKRKGQHNMIGFMGRSIAIDCTENHGIPVQRNGRLKRISASEVVTGRIPTVGYYHGRFRLHTAFARFMAAVICDGHIDRNTITFHLKKQRKITRLIELAEACGWLYSTHNCSDGSVMIRFHVADMRAVLALLDDNRTLDFNWLLNIAHESRIAFIHELPHWDGERSEGQSGRSTNFITTNQANAETVQAIAAVSGIQMLLRKKLREAPRQPLYIVSINKRTYARIECLKRRHYTYDGTVYCIANSQTGWIVVRHNNRICVTGNTNYGLTAYGMADEYEEIFQPQPGEKEKTAKAVAERYQRAYFDLFPEIPQWMDRLRQQAYTQRYLDNHFQYRHYFYDVFGWDSKRQQHVLGSDGKRCIAFRPQSDGSACQTEYMLGIEDRAVAGDERYKLLSSCLRLLIHDSLVFCIPEEAATWAPQAAAEVMNMPLAELGGLRIGVEVKMGRNMKDQEVAKVKLEN
jgi:hypothetical protein